MVDGYPRQVWLNQTGDEVIESYTIPQMAHGAPLATGEADDECGAAGPFLLEMGISSSYHIAKFFRLSAFFCLSADRNRKHRPRRGVCRRIGSRTRWFACTAGRSAGPGM